MRSARGVLSAALVLLASGCGNPAVPEVAAPSPSSWALPCDEGQQDGVALDVPGPGRPTPEKAVTPYAGAVRPVSVQRDGVATVVGLRSDKTVVRVFDVTKRADGWWPEGYRECWG